jgi:chemotaxis protein histidine kinase CheA
VAEFPIPSEDPLVMCQLSAVLQKFWLLLNPLLEQVREGLASAKLVKDMEQVTFSHPDTLAWLTSTVAQITQSLSKACEKEFATAWDAASQLESLLAKLPDPSCKEAEYRTEGAKVTKQVADLVAQIGQNEKVRLKGVSAVKQLSDIGLPGNPGHNGVSALFHKYEGGEAGFTEKVLKSAACGSVHVAMVAGLCLLRNGSLGSANDEGKMIRKQLQSVAEALKQKVAALKLCEKPDAELLHRAQNVLNEASAHHKTPDAGSASIAKEASPTDKSKEEKGKEKDKKDKKDKKNKKEKEKKEKQKETKEKSEASKAKKTKKAITSEEGGRDMAEEDKEPTSKKRKAETESGAGNGRGRGRGKGRGRRGQ